MRLKSSAFADGTMIPRRFTCDGDDVSPPLDWSDAPTGAHSFAILCDDPDAPAGTWHHWAVYDIPAARKGLAEDAGRQGNKDGLNQALNDFRRLGYGGPCPPPRHGIHHYHFRLLALSTERLELGKQATCRDVEHAARKHTLAEAILVGLYKR